MAVDSRGAEPSLPATGVRIAGAHPAAAGWSDVRRRTAAAALAVTVACAVLVGSGPGAGATTAPTTTTITTTKPTTAAPAPAPAWVGLRATASCSGRSGPVIRRVGAQRSQVKVKDAATATTVDVRRATWSGTVNYPVVIGGGRYACVSGGRFLGSWSSTTSWETMHSVAAIRVTSSSSTVEDSRVVDYGDAIRFAKGAQGFRVRRAYLTYIRDDCIENDWAYSGVVEDSFLDGCYNAFSARGYDSQDRSRDGSADLVTIQNSLVRLQPMEAVYKNRGRVPGHAGFFKWDARGPRLTIRNTVLRADQGANTVGLGIPRGKLAGCSGNTMVWLGSGPYPDPLPSCFAVTRDKRVWDRAVEAWRAAHGH